MIEELIKILDKGIDFNTVYSLHLILDGSEYRIKDKELWESLKLNLINSGYINGAGIITSKGKEVLKSLTIEEKIVKINNTYKDIYLKLGETLKSRIGKKQVMGYGGKYYMFSSALELENTLKRLWKFYPEYNDVIKLEQCMLNHIEMCCKKNNFAPAMQYFIIRENEKNKPICQIISAYDGLDEKEEKTVDKTTFDL